MAQRLGILKTGRGRRTREAPASSSFPSLPARPFSHLSPQGVSEIHSWFIESVPGSSYVTVLRLKPFFFLLHRSFSCPGETQTNSSKIHTRDLPSKIPDILSAIICFVTASVQQKPHQYFEVDSQ